MLRYTVYSGEVNGDRTPIARYAGRNAALLAARRIVDAGQTAFVRGSEGEVVVHPGEVKHCTTDLKRTETDAAAEYLRLVAAQVRELLDAAIHEDEQLEQASRAVTFDHGIASLIDQRRRLEANSILSKLVRFKPVLVEDLTAEQPGAAVAD